MTVARIKDDGRVGLVTSEEHGLVWVLLREHRGYVRRQDPETGAYILDACSGLGVQCFWPEEIEAID
jgi:hypothetical protein